MSRKKITTEMTREFRRVTAKILRKRGVKPSRADKRKARAGFEIVRHGPDDAPPGGWPMGMAVSGTPNEPANEPQSEPAPTTNSEPVP